MPISKLYDLTVTIHDPNPNSTVFLEKLHKIIANISVNFRRISCSFQLYVRRIFERLWGLFYLVCIHTYNTDDMDFFYGRWINQLDKRENTNLFGKTGNSKQSLRSVTLATPSTPEKGGLSQQGDERRREASNRDSNATPPSPRSCFIQFFWVVNCPCTASYHIGELNSKTKVWGNCFSIAFRESLSKIFNKFVEAFTRSLFTR